MMEDQKSKNRKIFNIMLFIFAAAVFYMHMKKVNQSKPPEPTQQEQLKAEAPQ